MYNKCSKFTFKKISVSFKKLDIKMFNICLKKLPQISSSTCLFCKHFLNALAVECILIITADLWYALRITLDECFHVSLYSN